MTNPIRISALIAVLVAAGGAAGPAGAEDAIDGFLFAKLANIGTRSEGPAYFLQRWDYSEIPVAKKSMLFQSDPKLQPLVGHKVTITGSMLGSAIEYSSVKSCEGTMACELPGR